MLESEAISRKGTCQKPLGSIWNLLHPLQADDYKLMKHQNAIYFIL